jgi:hypothetical protein
MPTIDLNIVLLRGAWADGSSGNEVTLCLRPNGITAVTTPLPLTSLAEEMAALDRTASGARNSQPGADYDRH